MQEEVAANNESKTKPEKNGLKVNRKLVSLIIVILVIVLGAWLVYSSGYKNGEKKGRASKTNSAGNGSNLLTTLPASGTVTKVSDKEITITLLGKETRTAKIDKNTKIATSKGDAKVSDIKTDSKVVMFTTKSGKDVVATRILIQ